MCGHVVAAGFDVTAFDIDGHALERAAAAGASAAASAAMCARDADAVITMLPAPPHVEAVVLGTGGVLEAMAPGSLLLEMSTSSIGLGKRIVEAAGPRGVEVLDAPVAGQSVGATAGTLAIYVGGDREAFDRATPLLQAMGDPERIFHMGAGGSGYTVKLLLNLLWFIHSVASAEVLTMGVLAGVELERLHAALVGSPANSNFLQRDVRPVLESGDYDDAFPMRLVTKDLGLAIDLARDVGLPVELSGLVEQIHRRARAEYGDDAGEISPFRLYEDLAGIKLRMGHQP
jgi:3-hydroxyisobutyrate dehydrogenase